MKLNSLISNKTKYKKIMEKEKKQYILIDFNVAARAVSFRFSPATQKHVF